MADEKEIPLDVKNDIQLAFDIYKNEKNKVNKLKLRTMLFSFVMYKASASEINSFIESVKGDKELFSFEDVCDLIKKRLQDAKERESDELFNYIAENNNENATLNKNELVNAFKDNKIDVEEEEIDKMMQYMLKEDDKEANKEENQEAEKAHKTTGKKIISREEFKKFYCEKN